MIDEVVATPKKIKRQSPTYVRATSPQGILELSGYWIYVMVL